MQEAERLPVASDFGSLLRHHRLAAGLSQEALAERARMSAIAISALERGHRRRPQVRTLALLAGALDLDEQQRSQFEAAARIAERSRNGAVTVGPWTGASAEAAPHNLPRQVTSLIGREDDLAKIAPLISEHQLVTLVGPGGVGKTRLALEVGESLLEECRDGVWLVELAAFDKPESPVQAVASALGLRDCEERSLLEVVLENLERRTLALILDNCEHLIEEVSRLVDAIVRHAPNVRIVATSREPLRVGAEHIYRVPPLAEPFAIDLFAERAQAARPDFALTDSNAAAVAEICRRLDGIPLAIELAAARVGLLSVTEIAEKLDQRFSILTAGRRAAIPRQQTLRALIEWSYNLLSFEEGRLLRKLSVFSGDFSFDSAAAACNENGEEAVFDLLASLVDKSLVHVEARDDTTRLRLHESVLAYAHERLVAQNEFAVAARAHAAAFLELAERLEAEWDDTPDVEWKAQAEPELENWRAALRWAFTAAGDICTGLRLIVALRPVWFTLAPGEGLAWVRDGLKACDDSQPERIRAWLELSAAHLSMLTQHYRDAAESARQALACFSKLDEKRGSALARLFGAAARGMLGDAEAKSDLRAALEESGGLGARRAVAAALVYLGALELAGGNAVAARPLFAQALVLFRKLGASRPAAHVALNLAELEFTSGNVTEALRLANEAREADGALNDLDSVAYDLCNIAAYEGALSHWEASATHARQALALARERRMTSAVVWAIQHLAATAALRPISDPRLEVEQRRRAARLVGFVNARLTEYDLHRDFTEQREYEQILGAVADTLGTESNSLIEEGRSWSEVHAYEECLLT